jgi:UrcA family protein
MFNPHRAITRLLAPAVMILLMMSLFANAQAADDSQEARSVTLQYLSRDLDSPQGASILYRRIRAAATKVCSPLESRALERKVLWDQCFNHAVANAVAAVHNEALSAYHMQYTQRWKQPRVEIPALAASR